MYNVVPVIRNGQVVDHHALNTLDRLIAEMDDPNSSNYKDANKLHLSGHACFDLLVNQHTHPVCFSGMYHRDSWPDEFFRISNRTYVVPQFRTGTYSFLNPTYIGPSQIMDTPLCALAFISRERPKSKYYFRKLQQVVPFYSSWTISDRMVQVYPSEHKSSYQYVISCSFAPHYSIEEMNSITEADWADLKD